jgi:ATP/maltotriose-dependent transcriptional regulator MalT
MVARAPEHGLSDPARAGWDALRDGRWEEARRLFEAALSREETAGGLEGLSWAAWWLDDADAVFPARERAYRLYRRAGDDAAAALMATWLAVDHLDFHGAWPVARGWFGRARRLLEPLDAGPEHGWLAFHEGYLAHADGDTAGARARAVEAAELGRRFDVVDLEMLGLALEGAALVAAAEVEAGMRCLDEATAAALEGDAAIPISGAWACCFLVTACAAVLDYERAAAWCDRIEEFADRYGSRYMLAFCRAEYGAVLLARGRYGEAAELLSAAVDDYARSRPAWAGGPSAVLAEVRRRQGRREDALALLGDAGSGSALLCHAQLALDAGDPVRARELLERRLRRVPPDRRLDRAPALALLVRAHVARGELAGAEAALEELGEVARLVGTGPLLAHADLAAGVLAAAAGDRERARLLLEDAVDGFERAAAPFECAQARVELATAMLALGRADAAANEAEAAHEALLAIGAEGEAQRARAILAAAAGSSPEPAGAAVTRREGEVLRLLAEGLTNRQIAARLVVSEHTVHRHVANILRKLELPSRTAAAAWALRAGIAE